MSGSFTICWGSLQLLRTSNFAIWREVSQEKRHCVRITKPKLLLADEPTGDLDNQTAEALFSSDRPPACELWSYLNPADTQYASRQAL